MHTQSEWVMLSSDTSSQGLSELGQVCGSSPNSEHSNIPNLEQPSNSKPSAQISDEAKQLLDILLDKDPLVRPSIEDIQAHPWVKRKLPEKFEIALVAIAEEQRALAATHSSPQKEMPDDVAELVRKACIQGFLGDPLLERVNLRPNHPLADAWVKSGIVEAGAEDQRSSNKAGPMTASASLPLGVEGVSKGKEVERTAAGSGGKGGATSVVDVAGVHAVLLPLSVGPDPVRIVSEEEDDMMSPFARVQLPVLSQGQPVVVQQQQGREQKVPTTTPRGENAAAVRIVPSSE